MSYYQLRQDSESNIQLLQRTSKQSAHSKPAIHSIRLRGSSAPGQSPSAMNTQRGIFGEISVPDDIEFEMNDNDFDSLSGQPFYWQDALIAGTPVPWIDGIDILPDIDWSSLPNETPTFDTESILALDAAVHTHEVDPYDAPAGIMDSVGIGILSPFEQSSPSTSWDSESFCISPSSLHSFAEPAPILNTLCFHPPLPMASIPGSAATPTPIVTSLQDQASQTQNHGARGKNGNRPRDSRKSKPSEDKRHICRFCHKGHKKKRDLERHYVSNHRPEAEKMGLDTRRRPCKYCEKTYARPDFLIRHLNRKHGRSPKVVL